MNPEDTDVVVSVMEEICAFNDADSNVYDLHDAANLLNQALPIAREYARLRPLYEQLLSALNEEAEYYYTPSVRKALKAITEAKRKE